MAVAPKLAKGGCFTAHNVSSHYYAGIREFLDYVMTQPVFATSINHASPEGISISYKTSAD